MSKVIVEVWCDFVRAVIGKVKVSRAAFYLFRQRYALLGSAGILVLFPAFNAPLYPQASSSLPSASSNPIADDFLPGLFATYSDDKHKIGLIVPDPDFYLEPDESLHPSIDSRFTAEWTGFISILQAGEYTFDAAPATLSIMGETVGEQVIELASGRHPVRVLYGRQPGVSAVRLRWKGPGFGWEPIPSSYFTHSSSQAPAPDEKLAQQGRELVENLGCVNCHQQESAQLKRRDGPDLTGVGSRVNPRWLATWFKQPHAFRSDAVMPVMLTSQQQQDVASYLLSLDGAARREQGSASGEGDAQRGNELYHSLGCGACHNERSVPLEGLGSKTTASFLAEYLRDPIKFDPSGQMPSFSLTREEAAHLAAYLVQGRNPAFETPRSGGDAGKGRNLVQSEGCLACHKLRDPESLDNLHTAPRLRDLVPNRGCLMPDPAAGVPRFELTDDQRRALQSFLASFKLHPDISPAPVYETRRELSRLRCVACHQADSTGPLAALNEATPPLTDAGAKLQSGWFQQVLMGVERARTSLHVRMPHYDSAHVQSFVQGLAKEAGVEPGQGPQAPTITGDHRSRGFTMLGMNGKEGGLGCIGCHDWGQFRSLGEEGPQLFRAAERLRYDWFKRWMPAPGRIISGTSMPGYFTSLPPQEAAEAITSLWAGLLRRQDVPPPEGLKVEEPPLGSEEKPLPENEAIVIRWDLPESTPASIAVGMPGGISYCFDAGESRLRYAWRGGFVDLSQTVVRKTLPGTRTTPTADIIGEIFYRVDSFPLRAADRDRLPQTRYRGYRLVEGYPEFHYQVDGIDVYERVIAAETGDGIIRQFTLLNVDQPMWFVTAQPEGVAITSTLGVPAGGNLSIPAGDRVQFDIVVKQVQ